MPCDIGFTYAPNRPYHSGDSGEGLPEPTLLALVSKWVRNPTHVPDRHIHRPHRKSVDRRQQRRTTFAQANFRESRLSLVDIERYRSKRILVVLLTRLQTSTSVDTANESQG